MVNPNVEIRILAHVNGLYKSYALEESGKGEDKSPKPEHTETTKLDKWIIST